MNSFESLCRLASDENWCWNLYCTTCGHMHFRYSFAELAKGKSPEDSNWIVHNKHRLSKSLGKLPRDFTAKQRESILHICADANLISISKYCKFPDWLGYLGLILAHMSDNSNVFQTLSINWSSQLKNMVYPQSTIYRRLERIEIGDDMLDIQDLESCESQFMIS